MNVLIINGSKVQLDKSKGALNSSLVNNYLDYFYPTHNVEITSIELGYNIQEERNKLLRADLVILQFPVFWFSVPGATKKYFDDVFDSGQLFRNNGSYGRGGKLKGSYILSATWNALSNNFNNKDSIFEGASMNDVFMPIHKTMQYLGLTFIKSFSVHDVINNPNMKVFKQEQIAFLDSIDFNNL